MIKVLDANNQHNDAIFNDNEEVMAIEYMQMLAERQNNTGCSLILSKNGKVQRVIVN